MASVQKRGLILPSGILVKRLISDKGFLKTLCTHVIFATKTYSDQASCLTTLYAFYTTAVLGVIELGSITEVHVNYLLPTLLHGLKSLILDFAASSYMIIAKLITKVSLFILIFVCFSKISILNIDFIMIVIKITLFFTYYIINQFVKILKLYKFNVF